MSAIIPAINGLYSIVSAKDEIIKYANALVNDVNNGYITALDTLIEIKKFEKVFELVEKQIKEQAITEGAEHNKQIHRECLIEIVPTAVNYDYSVCNDSIYNNLLEQEKSVKAMLKARQEMLKVGINPETGETFQKPIRTEKETVKITIR